MVQKKDDPRTKEIASMGAKAKNRLYPNKEWRFEQGSERTRTLAAKGMAARLANNPGCQSKAGKRSRIFENEIAAKLEGDHVFKPNEVCDRIVVRDGEVFFVEIKRSEKRLTQKQKTFQEIVGEKYQVVRS